MIGLQGNRRDGHSVGETRCILRLALVRSERSASSPGSGWSEGRLQPEKLDILNRKILRLIRCPAPNGESP